MKLTRRGAIDKCLKLWGKVVRTRDGKCLLCGGDYNVLNAHHWTPRGNAVGEHWFILDNGFTLCYICHSKVHSRSGDMWDIRKWENLVNSRLSQDRQDEIIRARHNRAGYTLEILEGIYENLAREYDSIKENI